MEINTYDNSKIQEFAATHRKYRDKTVIRLRGNEDLPRGWSAVEPNRIGEMRRKMGYNTVKALHEDLNATCPEDKKISYARLTALDSGRKIVRDSEYELLGQFFDVHPSDLKLNDMTPEQITQWNNDWGTNRRGKEGGDHKSVLLAAYLRKVIAGRGETIAETNRKFSIRGNAITQAAKAAKPPHLYTETVRNSILLVTGYKDWTDLLNNCQHMYMMHQMDDYIRELRVPAVHYSPEDPDPRAAWTTITNPDRQQKHKEVYLTAGDEVLLADFSSWNERYVEIDRAKHEERQMVLMAKVRSRARKTVGERISERKAARPMRRSLKRTMR